MKKEKRKRPVHTIAETLAWLEATHPTLVEFAEVDRAWVWLAVNLQGEENRAIRESIKAFGFGWKPRGFHILPSGASASWANACLAPTPFFKRGKRGAGVAQDGSGRVEVDSALMAELAAI